MRHLMESIALVRWLWCSFVFLVSRIFHSCFTSLCCTDLNSSRCLQRLVIVLILERLRVRTQHQRSQTHPGKAGVFGTDSGKITGKNSEPSCFACAKIWCKRRNFCLCSTCSLLWMEFLEISIFGKLETMNLRFAQTWSRRILGFCSWTLKKILEFCCVVCGVFRPKEEEKN